MLCLLRLQALVTVVLLRYSYSRFSFVGGLRPSGNEKRVLYLKNRPVHEEPSKNNVNPFRFDHP